MVVFLLSLLTRGVQNEKRLSYLLEIVERVRQQGVEPIQCHTFQTGGKGDAQEWVIVGIDHHLFSKMPDVLHEVTHLGVIVKGWS